MGVGDHTPVEVFFSFYCRRTFFGRCVTFNRFLFHDIIQFFAVSGLRQIPCPVPDFLAFSSILLRGRDGIILFEYGGVFSRELYGVYLRLCLTRHFIQVNCDAVRADAVLIVCIIPDLAHFEVHRVRVVPVDELCMGATGI